jgi:hypothetical protein
VYLFLRQSVLNFMLPVRRQNVSAAVRNISKVEQACSSSWIHWKKAKLRMPWTDLRFCVNIYLKKSHTHKKKNLQECSRKIIHPISSNCIVWSYIILHEGG